MADRATATLRFYEELNDFLPAEARKRDLPIVIDRSRSVKDAIESVGVPHTEVDLIVVDGRSVDFAHLLRGGERVAVYPMFEALVAPFTRCRECNVVLEDVEKGAVIDRLPEKVRGFYERFKRCRGCDRVYWEGTHFARMQGVLSRLAGATPSGA